MPVQRLLFLTELLKHPAISHSEVHRYLSKQISHISAEAMALCKRLLLSDLLHQLQIIFTKCSMLLQHVCSNQQLKHFLLPSPMIYEHMGGQSIAHGCWALRTACSLKAQKVEPTESRAVALITSSQFQWVCAEGQPTDRQRRQQRAAPFLRICAHLYLLMKLSHSPMDRIQIFIQLDRIKLFNNGRRAGMK